MGQYYKAINISRAEFLSSYAYDNGAKLMEHSWIGNSFVGHAMVRLCDESMIASSKKLAAIPFAGSWANDKIVWAGDYMDEDIFMPDNYKTMIENSDDDDIKSINTLYGWALEFFHEEKDKHKNYDVVFSLKDVYFLNHDTKEFMKIPSKPDPKEWVVNPVSLLLASGNGRGGGDYSGDDEDLVGIWAGCSVCLSRKVPSDYKEISPNFNENI